VTKFQFFSSAKTFSFDKPIVFATKPNGTKSQLLSGAVKISQEMQAQIQEHLDLAQAKGKKLETVYLSIGKGVVCVGLGKLETDENTFNETLRRVGANATRALAGRAEAIFAIDLKTPTQVESLLIGVGLGGYQFSKYKTKKEDLKDALKVASLAVQDSSENKKSIERANLLIAAVCTARDLVNTPPADLVPNDFADFVKKQLSKNSIKIEVLNEKTLKAKGYGGIYAVGMGSIHPPRLVRAAYSPTKATKHLIIVGKGITFDTGGISLKPPASMITMKSDMAGAAAVMQTLNVIAQLKLNIKVTAYAALAENMPSHSAQRPSDVIKIYGGKTVEVLNTDAEGRLVLADALVRAQEDKPDYLINVATLTGAASIALGKRTAGVMGNSVELIEKIIQSSAVAGESMWHMPIPEEIRSGLDSEIADIANIPTSLSPAGGMLRGAAFLKDFVKDEIPWAHIDIAPNAFNDSSPYGYVVTGGTGIAVRTLVELASQLSQQP
jgi:leucyl aminopeptidase